MLTLTELAERLKQLDEITLMEVLGLSSEDLVYRCMDIIEDNYEQLAEDLDDNNPRN